MEIAGDFKLSEQDAKDLMGVVLLPHEFREEFLALYKANHGADALVNLFSQFVGMANSVIENNRQAIMGFLVSENLMQPATAARINLPTLSGALNGVVVANGIKRKTCGTCAFRLGSVANQCLATTLDVQGQKAEKGDFMCHESLDDKLEPTRRCAGFAQYRRAVGR